jgi:ABC-2 type transport system permease protein
MSLRPFAALVRKDIRGFLNEPRAMILSFLAPVLLATFFAFVLGGTAGDGGPASKIALRVVNEDGGKLADRIVEAIAADANLDATTVPREAAREDVRRGRAVAALVIPEGFGEAASSALFSPQAEKPTITILVDPTHAAEVGMVKGILTQHVMQNVSREAFSGSGESPALKQAEQSVAMATDLSPALKDSLQAMFRNVAAVREQMAGSDEAEARGGGFGGMGVPYETREEAVTAGNQQARVAMHAHAFSGMATQFILFAAIESGVGLLTERRYGLWKRLRAAPLSRFELLGARLISGAIIALMITVVVFLAGAVLFGIRIQGGSAGIVGFLLVATGYALTASAVGLLIAALGKTPQAARGVSVLIVLLLVMLGGAWMPRFLFPAWIQRVSALVPTRWAVDGFDAAFVRAETLAELLGPAAILFAFAAVIALLAAARFRWEEA